MRLAVTHEIEVSPTEFGRILTGKQFLVLRSEADFQDGDRLVILERDHQAEWHTGRVLVRIGDVERVEGLVVVGLRETRG
jgi:hypothetical protein